LDCFQPDIIFHLAAHAYLDGSYEYPADIFEINVMGTVGLLEEVRRSGRRIPVVVITSDKCYAQALRGRPCREADPFGAAEAYSSSKACQDLAAQCYGISFPSVPVATARASNTIGGGDFNQNRLVPHLLDRFAHGRPAQLRNPDFVRPWQYVLDVLWGYLTLGKDLSSGDLKGDTAFNFGPAPDGFQTVGRVAELLAAHFLGARYERQSGCCSGETEILRLDSEKARRILGWRPQYTLEEALAQTAAFYKKMQEVPAAQLCREQAEQYIERVRSRVKLS
jgi:CDP-glucose 4,6-dehydratase